MGLLDVFFAMSVGCLSVADKSAHVNYSVAADLRDPSEAPDLFTTPGRGISIARCAHFPPGHSANCAEVDLTGTRSLSHCVALLKAMASRGADTLNWQHQSIDYGACQLQRCGPAGRDPELQNSAGFVPHVPGHIHHVYSYRCNRPPPLILPEMAAKVSSEQAEAVVGRSHDYYTSSSFFKRDLRAFFGDIAKNWTVVELGAYRGYTTRVLSEIFRQVIAIDASEVFLNQNRAHNADKGNIVYLQLHSRFDGLRILKGSQVQVVFVDADHDRASVSFDLEECLRCLGSSIRYFLFDDFGLDEGIRHAIADFITAGKVKIKGGLGAAPPWAYEWFREDGKGMEMITVHMWEGMALEVLTSPPAIIPFAAARARIVGRWYHWLEGDLLCSEGRIMLQEGGKVELPWGAGGWSWDGEGTAGGNRGETFIGASLEWHGEAGQKQRSRGWYACTWKLRFSENGDKFAAVCLLDPRRNAAGVSQDVMESIRRRLFLSVDLEWCNNAQECYSRKN